MKTVVLDDNTVKIIDIKMPIVNKNNVLRGGLVKIPDNVHFDNAALIEPIACCLRSLNKINVKKADQIAIFGAGPTGLIHMILTRYFGVSKIIMIDLNDFRLNYAKKIDPNIIPINIQKMDKQVFEKLVFSENDDMGVDISIIST